MLTRANRRGRNRARRGVALILVLFAVAMAFVLAIAFSVSQATSTGISENGQRHTQARVIAESGLEIGINYVQTSATWRTDLDEGDWVIDLPLEDGSFTLTGQDGEDLDGDGVIDGAEGDGDLADDTSDKVTLTVVGTFDGVTHTVRAVVTPATVQPTESGISAWDKVEIKERGVVDSFDSRTGPYGGGNVGSEAVITNNSTSNDKITVKNNAVVNGSVYCGPGGNPASVVSIENNGEITGDASVLDQAVDIPDEIDEPDVGASSGNVTYSSGTTTISSDQHFNKFKIESDAIVQISGAVTILCDDDFAIKNNAQLKVLPGGILRLYTKDKFKAKNDAQVNINTADPSKLIICQLSSQDVHLEGNSRMYATVLAPDGELYLKSNSQFYGSFAGKDVKVEDDGRLHHDLGTSAVSVVLPEGEGADTPQLVALYEFSEVPLPDLGVDVRGTGHQRPPTVELCAARGRRSGTRLCLKPPGRSQRRIEPLTSPAPRVTLVSDQPVGLGVDVRQLTALERQPE